MARRHLGMSPGEWDSLRWHERRMYLEGYENEGLIQRGGTNPRNQPNEPGLVSESSHTEGRNIVTESQYHHDLSNIPGEFAAVGLRERTL